MSREAVLRGLCASLKATGGGRRSSREIAARLAEPPRHLIPAIAIGSRQAMRERFISCLEEQSVVVHWVRDAAGVPGGVERILSEWTLPAEFRCGADRRLMSLPWDTAPGVVRQSGAAEPGDRAALSHAEAGVAETGTLVLLSGSGNPTSLAFLSETHIVVIAEQTIVGCYEDAFDMVRSQLGGAPLPRALNLVGGASRTGDIGGRIVMGAHGPRRLAVIIYPSDAPARWSSDGRGPSAGRGTPGDSA